MNFVEHMTWHMALVTVLAPAAAATVRGTRFDPVRAAPAAFSPLAACLIDFIVVWAWHAPPLHQAARHDAGWFALEQLSFAAAAIYLWLSILGGDAAARHSRQAAGVVALVLTFAHMTMLGALIALAPRDIYEHGGGALAGQQRGGAIMLLAGTTIYPVAAVWLSRSLLTRVRSGA